MHKCLVVREIYFKFCLLDLVQNDKDLHILTNLNTMQQFEALELCISSSTFFDTLTPIIKSRLPIALLLFLTKLKTNMDFRVLGLLFRVTNVTASAIFFEMVAIMRVIFEPFVCLTTKEEIEENLPVYFVDELESTYIILDGMEIEISMPSCLHCKIISYSRYKSKLI